MKFESLPSTRHPSPARRRPCRTVFNAAIIEFFCKSCSRRCRSSSAATCSSATKKHQQQQNSSSSAAGVSQPCQDCHRSSECRCLAINLTAIASASTRKLTAIQPADAVRPYRPEQADHEIVLMVQVGWWQFGLAPNLGRTWLHVGWCAAWPDLVPLLTHVLAKSPRCSAGWTQQPATAHQALPAGHGAQQWQPQHGSAWRGCDGRAGAAWQCKSCQHGELHENRIRLCPLGMRLDPMPGP